MTDHKGKTVVHTDTSEVHQGIGQYNQSLKCPEHPEAPVEDGYGMAGGGFGVYNYCSECGRVLSKSPDPFME